MPRYQRGWDTSSAPPSSFAFNPNVPHTQLRRGRVPSMDSFFDRLVLRAATIDEVLSNDFEPLTGQKEAAELAGRRLAAWCRSCANGDWSLFSQRLARDGLAIGDVLARFASVRPNPRVAQPTWIADAMWIDQALSVKSLHALPNPHIRPVAFEHLFQELVQQAESRLQLDLRPAAVENLSLSARTCLRHNLLEALSKLSAPALYEQFQKARDSKAPIPSPHQAGTSLYENFITEMTAGGLRRLFQDRPVLLRLLATITRQWIDTWREFILRLDTDMEMIRRNILGSTSSSRVQYIEVGLSDAHNGGHSVHVVRFEDGSRVVYKPKDLHLDIAWERLISKLNEATPPLSLKAVKTIALDGYGWTEFIEHAGCQDSDGCKRFYARAGAWLALFHCLCGTDFHQENMIASGEHPVPIDLETMLQPTTHQQKSRDPEAKAYEAAIEVISNSVCTVGLLPGLIKLPSDEMLAVGGMVPYRSSITSLTWEKLNSDEMRPSRATTDRSESPNLPHVDGHYATLEDHRYEFVNGFRDYARYLASRTRDGTLNGILGEFSGLPIRRVLRATSFYYGLIHRLQNFDSMDDGIMWSAQADFVARFSNWDHDIDPFSRLQRAERTALLSLNVPYFLTTTDGYDICDWTGALVTTQVTSGVDRARERLQHFDDREIEWQLTVIEENTNILSQSAGSVITHTLASDFSEGTKRGEPTRQICLAEADRIAEYLGCQAIRRGASAAWLGIDKRHSEFGRFVALGPDLYNGNCGIALFLAAHAAVTGNNSSEELALAAVAHLRKNLRSRNAARMVRLLGLGGAAGLGSIVYALTTMAKCLGSPDLLSDARAAAELFTNDVIGADKRLDVMHGSAGAILGLLSLHRVNDSGDVLERAVRCGEHLLAQPRRGVDGRRSWVGQGLGKQPLNGMSHGAAGYAYALASLAAATGREQFADAASECIVFENSSFDPARSNWPDWRETVDHLWRSQWCHGATGIGLARLAIIKCGVLDRNLLRQDVDRALSGAEQHWPGRTDTMCCGTIGNVEFFRTAGRMIFGSELSAKASSRLLDVITTASSSGSYRWYGSNSAFNLGLFLGVAGVGYACLREIDTSVPNVLVWE